MIELEKIKKKTIRRSFFIILLILLIIFTSSTIVVFKFNYDKFIKQNILFFKDIIKVASQNSKNNYDFSQLSSRVTIIDCSGKVLYDNKADAILMETHFDRSELLYSTQKGNSYYIRTSKTLGKKMLYYSEKILKNDKCVAFIRFSVDLKELRNNNISFLIINLIVFILLFFTFLSIILSYNRYLFSLLNLSINKLKNISNDEKNISILSQSNIFFYSKKIRNKIESLVFSSISEAKDKMIKTEIEIISNIFESFDEPVFIFSNQGECLFSNKIGRKIFIPDKFQYKYKGKYFWEIFINSDINNKIQNVIENKDKILSEVEFGDYLFLMRTIHLSLIDSIFIIFTDISEAKKYFELKKGIFSAITHELKTPLTSINGFLEQIIIEAQDKNLQEILSYSEIAKRNTSRLILLTNDIIELEKTHYKRNLNPLKFEIVNLLNEIILLFSETASKKNIDLIFENKDQTLFFNTDKDLFEQIAINLIDNAIKYTEKGYVKIYINKLENEIQFIVEDSGIGIEPGEISKIFEPFYCVDKSRSRQKGGTGLGLSIVKKAIDNLGGSIEVISSPYKGSKFIVTLREIK